MLQDLFVGLKHAGLVVGDGVLLAESPDDRLRLPQLVAGQPREQVVFDLVVETAVPEVGDRVGYDVAAGQYLPAQEVHLAVAVQEGHGFVVWREDRDQVSAEEPAMDGDEEERLQRFQHREQESEIQRVVSADRQGLDQGTLRLLRGEELYTAAEHADRLQEREGEYEGCLVFHDEAREPPFFEGLPFVEGEQWDLHVGVEVHLVGVAVMLVVLVDPPLAAHAERQVAKNEGEPVVLPGAAKGELPVSEVVGEEAYLDEDEGQVSGVQGLEPGIAEDEQQGQAHRQQAEREDRLDRIVGRLPVQKSVLFDETLQLGVLIGP